MSALFPDSTIPVAAQIACVEREIRMREQVYPRRVGAGKMTQRTADNETECMRAVLATLKGLCDGRR